MKLITDSIVRPEYREDFKYPGIIWRFAYRDQLHYEEKDRVYLIATKPPEMKDNNEVVYTYTAFRDIIGIQNKEILYTDKILVLNREECDDLKKSAFTVLGYLDKEALFKDILQP